MPRRILVGYDGSRPARAAFDYAVAAAREGHATLTVLLALPMSTAAGSPWMPMAGDVVAESRQALQDELAAHVAALPVDISVTRIVSEAPPGPALIAEAERGHHDVIFIGVPAGPWHKISGGILGYLQRHSPIPVVAVPSTETAEARSRSSRNAGHRRHGPHQGEHGG